MPARARSPVITRLDDHHAIEEFDCGEPSRNSWLVTRALSNQRSDDARTYVAVDGTKVLAFYAITVSSILRASLNAAMRRNAPEPVGCVLLAQLAVSTDRQGIGLGRDMVLHAMRQAIRITDLGGGRLFAVHPARPELIQYYGRFGFVHVATTPILMVMTMEKARATLDALQA